MSQQNTGQIQVERKGENMGENKGIELGQNKKGIQDRKYRSVGGAKINEVTKRIGGTRNNEET